MRTSIAQLTTKSDPKRHTRKVADVLIGRETTERRKSGEQVVLLAIVQLAAGQFQHLEPAQLNSRQILKHATLVWIKDVQAQKQQVLEAVGLGMKTDRMSSICVLLNPQSKRRQVF